MAETKTPRVHHGRRRKLTAIEGVQRELRIAINCDRHNIPIFEDWLTCAKRDLEKLRSGDLEIELVERISKLEMGIQMCVARAVQTEQVLANIGGVK